MSCRSSVRNSSVIAGVRVALDQLDEYDTVHLARKAIGPGVGVGVESLRRWVQQAQVDAGEQPGSTSVQRAGIKELERENRDRREANEIFSAASVFSGELDPASMGHRISLICKALTMLGLVFTERTYRAARRWPASDRTVRDAAWPSGNVTGTVTRRNPNAGPRRCSRRPLIAFERPSTMSSSRAGPAPSRIARRSMMTYCPRGGYDAKRAIHGSGGSSRRGWSAAGPSVHASRNAPR